MQWNMENGTVQDNRWTVEQNYGTVQNNRRTVLMNTELGTVKRNTGTVAENSGMVDNYTNGIVTLNKEGGIVFNYGGSITENLGIELFQVTINRSANTSVTKAAAKRGDVTIIILYTHWGQDCTLTIPTGTDFSALFEAQFLEVSQLPALLHLSAV